MNDTKGKSTSAMISPEFERNLLAWSKSKDELQNTLYENQNQFIHKGLMTILANNKMKTGGTAIIYSMACLLITTWVEARSLYYIAGNELFGYNPDNCPQYSNIRVPWTWWSSLWYDWDDIYDLFWDTAIVIISGIIFLFILYLILMRFSFFRTRIGFYIQSLQNHEKE